MYNSYALLLLQVGANGRRADPKLQTFIEATQKSTSLLDGSYLRAWHELSIEQKQWCNTVYSLSAGGQK